MKISKKSPSDIKANDDDEPPMKKAQYPRETHKISRPAWSGIEFRYPYHS